MGAVSNIDLSEVAKKDFQFLDTDYFDGGYIDQWGSYFIIDKVEDGRYMMSLKQLGGYLHETALGGWENDYVLKSVNEGTYSGSIFQWGRGNPPTRYIDIEYLIINNELIGISQGGILFWVKDKDESVEDLSKRCLEIDSDFFCYGEKPKRFATEEEFRNFPLVEVKKTGAESRTLNISFKDTTSANQRDFFNRWATEVIMKPGE